MKVLPKNDSVRNLLKHPTGRAFPENGSVDWPDDAFTARRIADGDVTVEEEKRAEETKPASPVLAEKTGKRTE